MIVGPTTPVPTCRSTTPSTRSVIPTLTSNPQNKTRATPTPENQTPSTERPSSPPAQISPTPLNQTSDTPILSNPNTTGETSAEDETITAMLKGEKCCRNTLKPAQHSPECDLQVLFNADSVNLGLSSLEAELVDAIRLTEHVGPETTTSSEPDGSTPALQTQNQEQKEDSK